MGKRELVLILAFVAAGAVVYQATAPPRDPGRRGFSFADFFRRVRSEVTAHSASTEVKIPSRHKLPAAARELRLFELRDLEVIGEDRADLEAELTVYSTGPTPAEAEALARQTTLKLDPSGDSVNVRVAYPEAGQQRSRVALKVPRSLRIYVDGLYGRAEIRGVAEVQLSAAGEIVIAEVGVVRGEKRGGRLDVTGAREVRVTSRQSQLRLEKPQALELDLTGGQVQAIAPGGPVEIDAQNCRIDISEPAGPVRINASRGRAQVSAPRQDLRFDGRGTNLTIRLAVPASIAAFTSDASIELVDAPAGGYTLDAAAIDGALTLPDESLRIVTDGSEKRAAGDVRGGGPTITLRATRGSVSIVRPGAIKER